MDESEENTSAEAIQSIDSPNVKIKPKKRSLVERELETNLTARVTSPVTSEGTSTSRYGRARRLKTAADMEAEKIMKPLKIDVSKQPQAYKMHASNSPVSKETPKRTISVGSSIEDQIENIYIENISLSRFGSEEKTKSQSPGNKVYIRKDLIQKPDTDTVVLIKNMFSPNKSNSHLNNILERSSEKYALNGHGKAWNGFPDTSSVVKTLDFDGKKKKKDVKDKETPIKEKVTTVKEKVVTTKEKVAPFKEKFGLFKEKQSPFKEKLISKNELFDLEAACEYQVGDLAWARVGTYPFWPCIVTREPFSDMFVKKKLFGRVERSVIHVTFFGDNGRRGWIVDNMLRKYQGRAEFEACRDKFTAEAKKKDPRLYAAHFVSEKKLPLWNASVDEAETLNKEPKRLRIDLLYDMLVKARASKTTPKREKGGKISRTDSDVSLSESLYDTLFSEDDGKTDDGNRLKRSRNKSLDVSEVVTACLDNMAAKSGIIQIQRQSHMDRWLQKAKSKTPEKMQPKLQLKVEREKRKNKAKKKSKESKKSHKVRKNESLGSDSNLLPYQNEHDYSSVNYENHDINDSSNKNTDSTSGFDSTLDTSDIGVVVKIENISSSMEDLSQDDIITTVVNDDIVMTDPENTSKDDNDHSERSDNINNKIKDASEHLDNSQLNENEQLGTKSGTPADTINDKLEDNSELNVDISNLNENCPVKPKEQSAAHIKDETRINEYEAIGTKQLSQTTNSNLSNKVQTRHSKRKRQTLEGPNNSMTESKTIDNVEDAVKDKNVLDEGKVDVNINDKVETNIEHILESSNLNETKQIETNEKLPPTDTNKKTKNNNDHFENSHLNEIEQLQSKAESQSDNINIKIDNNDKHRIRNNHMNKIDLSDIKGSPDNSHGTKINLSVIRSPPDNSAQAGDGQPRRSKRKRQTLEGLNNSITESKPIDNIEDAVKNKNVLDEGKVGDNINDKIKTNIEHVLVSSNLNETKQIETNEKLPTDTNDKIKNCNDHPKNSRLNENEQIQSNAESQSDNINIKIDNNVQHRIRNSHANKIDLSDIKGSSDNSDQASEGQPRRSKRKRQTFEELNNSIIESKPVTSLEDATKVDNDHNEENAGDNINDKIQKNNVENILDISHFNKNKQSETNEEGSPNDINDKIENNNDKFPENSHPNESKETQSKQKSQSTIINIKIENNDEHSSRNSHSNKIELTDTKGSSEYHSQASDVQPRRSKRKRQTLEGLNNSTEHKAKEPKLELTGPNIIDTTIIDSTFTTKVETNKSCDNTDKDSSEPTVSNVAIEPSQQDKLMSFESTSFTSNSKPVVVIEPLNLDGLETQLIIKGSKQFLQSTVLDKVIKNYCTPYQLGTSDGAQNDSVSAVLKHAKNALPEVSSGDGNIDCINSKPNADIDTLHQSTDLPKQVEFSKVCNEKTENNLVDSEKMEIDNCCIVETPEQTDTTSAESLETKTADVPKESLVHKNEEITDKNNFTNVVIGEETYIFDRTSSQDYDEIDAGEYDEASNSPADSSNTKDSSNINIIKVRTDLLSNENSDTQVNDQMKCNETGSISFKNKKKSLSKRAACSKEKNETQKAMQEPEFLKYLEIRQDALLDEQPDLTQDEIVTYLYQNWLYEEGNKSDAMKIDEHAQSTIMKDLNQETTLQPTETKQKYKVSSTSGLKNVDIRHMMQKDKPADSSNKNAVNINVVQSISSSQGEALLEDYNKNDDKTIALNSTDKLLSSHLDHVSSDDSGSKAGNDTNTNTLNILPDFNFLNKEATHDDSNSVALEDNKQSTSDVSSKVTDEQNEVTNPVTEENNDKCVFLDQRLTDAQSSDSIQKKIKSPRLSLNRTRKPIVKLNRIVGNELLGYENSIRKLNTHPEKCSEIASVKPKNSDETIPKCVLRSKEKQATEKAMNEPEFIKYLELCQDTLLDEQPDLTQDEIVTYLYQNWLYEEGKKSDIKKIDDNEQSNSVKGVNQKPVPQPKKKKKKIKVETAPDVEIVDIREMLFREQLNEPLENINNDPPGPVNVPSENVLNTAQESENGQNTCAKKLETCMNNPEESDSHKENNDSSLMTGPGQSIDICTGPKCEAGIKTTEMLTDTKPEESETLISPIEEAIKVDETICCDQEKTSNVESSESLTITENIKLEETNVPGPSQSMDNCSDLLNDKDENKDSNEPARSEIYDLMEIYDIIAKRENNDVFDPETASIKSEDSGVSINTSKGRSKEKQDMKKSRKDPEFIKYLEARRDTLIDEQPDLTQEEIVTYLYQTWFYEESQKSDVKKSDENEQSNLVKGLNPEPVPKPKKIKKKKVENVPPKEEQEPPKVEKVPVQKALKNADIRDMIQKPKRKATQSKPYYNEDDSDLEEEDLETFKIFDRDEQNGDGEEIDEVELYFEQLTKPKPNVFKGYVRERVCEICDSTGNLVKCKSCHGTFHVGCVKKETEAIEVAAPTRGRKKKRGRKPKGYDPLLDSGSQSDERSQDANNSEELNISIEDEAESHIVVDADNFETQWENKMKELQTEHQSEYASDQEINWDVEPGRCDIVDLKPKEKPLDYSDYKCNNCLKYETPVCFVCKSDKSPKSQTEVRQKCHVAHCHRYYHLECLDHWPQTQFNSWEPSKTNKKVIEYIEALSCPRHVCHTCVSDDPRGCKTRFCGDKLARCVKCPATYHSYTKCLPAGTQILTGSQIICPRHYENRPGKVPYHVNTGWCFICALGGTLICCEYCPTSFHAECLNIKPPEGSYMCEDCETGRLPLYGEMVWVKLGHYRWWPGIVLHPTEIPDNILAVKHSPGDFVVRFFGQYDHYWVNRGRVFPFQEGDSGRISSQKSKIDAAFTTAMEHAQRACEILKKMEPNEEEEEDIASSLLPPHYVKLKVNKPVGNVARREIDANSLTQCDCDPTQPDPCGPYSHCLNRMLLTECGPLCRAGERCNNRAFERRLYPRLQPHRTPQRGWGLRTLDHIKQGQFVIEYVGELIDLEEFRRRMCRKHEIRDENFYFLTLDKERMIDAGPKGNLARFMNHCCEPNCETQKWTVLGDVRVGLFALRDIPANSEVTFNYNLECAGIEKKRCLCGAKRCSGYIGAKPKQLQDDQPKKTKPPAKRTYKKRKPVEDKAATPKTPKIKIKPIKPRELTEIEKDLLIIKNATNGMSSDSEGSRVSVEDKDPKALKRKRVSFSTEDVFSSKKAKIVESDVTDV